MERKKTGILKGICISKKRGTKKTEVAEAMLVENYGIESDAHAGNWHRQVSLLSLEKIEALFGEGKFVYSSETAVSSLVGSGCLNLSDADDTVDYSITLINDFTTAAKTLLKNEASK